MIPLAAVAIVPWLLCVAASRVANRLDRWIVPATAVIVLPVIAGALALSAAVSAAAVGAVALEMDSWTARSAGAIICALLLWRLAQVARHSRLVVAGARSAAEFGRRADPVTRLLVIDDDVPDAFATAAGGGAVVITTGLASELSDEEMNAVVLHERAHLRGRHHLAIQSTELAAQLIPLLRPIVSVVRHSAERQADECAAHGNRRLALTALARAALVCSRGTRASGVASLASTGGDVVRRVRALSGPPPAPQRRIVVAVLISLVVFVGLLTGALVDVVQDVVSPEQGEASTDMFE